MQLYSGEGSLVESFPHALKTLEGVRRYISAFGAPLPGAQYDESGEDPHPEGLFPPCHTSFRGEGASTWRLPNGSLGP